ncbi:NnrU family protein [Marinobacterium sedimentorum]|uniref:NnrU family protein n=1 Tax=Marinobacterium sedimentorum TaxID=2927804 RepID=UPI0020C6EB04|nr:NnrU family protein [Marinobacterium sedimentorum]MCP8687255.1 NnrU family protein [Marinobacterium sedimentorum]
MDAMVLGLTLFFGVHALPLLAGVRQQLIGVFGRWFYLGLFSLGSLTGLSLMLQGYQQIEGKILWPAVGFGHPLAVALMPLALILIIAAYLPTFIKRKVRHPMLIGVALWAAVHLLANGDLASTLLFAPFLAYSLVDMLLTKARKTLIPVRKPQLYYDILAVIFGLMAYGALLLSHGHLFGAALL